MAFYILNSYFCFLTRFQFYLNDYEKPKFLKHKINKTSNMGFKFPLK